MGKYDRRKGVQARVEEKVIANQCLVDGCARKPSSRGLCEHHRQLLYHELSHCETQEQRAAHESNAVQAGLVLMPGELVKIKRRARSPFANVGVAT